MAPNRLFYFSRYYPAWAARRPWWQYVFYNGEYDRDDKVVDWVIRHYAPGDGLSRHPLRAQRNTWRVPEVAEAGIDFVVSEIVRDALVGIGSACEFQEVSFEYLYEVPWGEGINAPLPDDASEGQINRVTRAARFTSCRKLGPHFELISVRRRDHYRPVPGHPYWAVKGELSDTRTIEVGGDKIAVDIDASTMSRYQAIYYGGAGLICTKRVADVLRAATDPTWFALDELRAEEKVD